MIRGYWLNEDENGPIGVTTDYAGLDVVEVAVDTSSFDQAIAEALALVADLSDQEEGKS
jgi:hypothetical protein